jgi:hypothetical protein
MSSMKKKKAGSPKLHEKISYLKPIQTSMILIVPAPVTPFNLQQFMETMITTITLSVMVPLVLRLMRNWKH